MGIEPISEAWEDHYWWHRTDNRDWHGGKRLICRIELHLLNFEDLANHKIIYSAVDEKPEVTWK
jgi:hypothetical protein